MLFLIGVFLFVGCNGVCMGNDFLFFGFELGVKIMLFELGEEVVDVVFVFIVIFVLV